jgi:hypothetical protein
MYSLTICFGPTGTTWAYLFKEEPKAGMLYNAWVEHKMHHAVGGTLIGADDFGQSFALPFDAIHGMMLEDLDQIVHARIERSLVDARAQMMFDKRAKTDPVIAQGIRERQQIPMLTPVSGFPR